MKKFTLVVACLLLVFVSCKSAPKTPEEEPQTVETPAEKEAEKSTSSTKPKTSTTTAKAATPKNSSSSSKSSTAKSSTSQSSTKNQTTSGTTSGAAKNAETAISQAKELSAQCKERGLDKQYSAHFSSAQSDINAAESSLKSSKYADAQKSANSATSKLQTLINLDDCNVAKTEIQANDFGHYDAKNFSDAEIEYIKAVENVGKNYTDAYNYSTSALKKYNTVVDAGYKEWTSIAKENALKARANCDAISANKSEPTNYTSAVTLYSQASKTEAAKNYREAYSQYDKSAALFTSVYNTVYPKRREAQIAMEIADQKQSESSVLAAYADQAAPLDEVLQSNPGLDAEVKSIIDGE